MNNTTVGDDVDVIIIGAGVSGLYNLYRLRLQGLNACIVEAGSGVGGTWYWNRYPGARFDSESYSYQYSFSDELLEEWEWSEHFSPQPDNERYLNFVADKFKLKEHIDFNARVKSATYCSDANRWTVETENGTTKTAHFLITAVGILSAPNMPPVPGIDSFTGTSFHTARWPKEEINLRGKRVGVIGAGGICCSANPYDCERSWTPYRISARTELLLPIKELENIKRRASNSQK